MKFVSKTIGILSFVLMLSASSAMAADELMLCGIIDGIDMQSRKITIDVVSEVCWGERKFFLAKNIMITPADQNRQRCFFIDSNTCQENYIYTITRFERD